MPNVDRTVEVATAIGIAVLGADSFHKFVPSPAEVRAAKAGDKTMRANVHAGEFIAGIGIVTVGFMASTIAGNGLPLFIGGVSFLAMFATYEYLLRSEGAFE